MDPISEEELIALIRQAAGAGAGAPLLGIGDDAAILAPASGGLVCTVDDHREDVHFRRRWCPPEAIGRRAAGSALSDLAAMGARPRGLLLALQLPARTDRAFVEALIAGFCAKAAAVDAPLIGGNLCRAGSFNLSVTALGEVEPGRALRRDAARVGDHLWLSGGLGGSALAFAALESGEDPDPELRPLIARYLDPAPLIVLGQALSSLAGERSLAAMDISDGLARDAARMARASGLTLVIDAAVTTPAIAALARARGEEPQRLALGSGEEYQLLVSAPPERDAVLEELGLMKIGEARAGAPGAVLDGAGRVIEAAWGFDHFS